MKAFSARLTAGAAIIFLGAIMAAQAQRENKDSQSSWSTEAIPNGSTANPIASGDLHAAMLNQAKSWNGESLGEMEADPIGNAKIESDASDAAIRLVQHTEDAATMSLPETSSADANAPAAPAMPMRFPSFDDVAGAAEKAETSSGGDTAASSITMGIPERASAELDSEAGNGQELQASTIRFADSPVESFQKQTEGEAVLHGEAPTNGLRGSAPLREEFGSPAVTSSAVMAEDVSGVPNGEQPLPATPTFESGPSFAAGPSISATPEVTSSDNPAAGVPAAMLTPVMAGSAAEAGAAPDFAAAPRATMQLSSEPAAIVDPQNPAQENSLSGATVANSTAEQNGSFGGTTQPVAGIGDQGFAQSAGGFGVPANYGMPQANGVGAGQDVPTLPAPINTAQPQTNPTLRTLPSAPLAAAPAGNSFNAAPTQPAVTMGNPSLFQSVGHKQRGTGGNLAAGGLPAAPALASPGDRKLDGPQSPSIVIQKMAPPEVKVGKTATFKILVRNVGGSPALDVVVKDRVPTGMEIVDATPRPNPNFQPDLVWMLGDMEPGQEHTITLQLTPVQEGTLGSVAQVSFNASASVRTTSTRPELKIVQKARQKIPVGQQLEIELEVSNPGTGEATGVVMQEDVPVGLKHPQGRELDNLIGTLRPGEVRRQVLRMQAVEPGVIQNVIRVKGDDGLEATHTIAIEVIAPELKVALSGPTRRYLERQATFYLEVANVGTDVARNVDISVQLDRGFTFVSTDYEGQYDSSRHAVFWSLPALPVGESGRVPLTLLPVEEGARVLRTEARADMNVSATSERQVAVDSLAELTFSIHDSADPVEVGGESVYEIRVSNSGSRDDTNVRVQVALPQGMQLAQQQGDFQEIQPGVIEFATRALLKANDEVVYRVKTIGRSPGRHKVKAIVTSDQSDVPVTKEESIMVYADQ